MERLLTDEEIEQVMVEEFRATQGREAPVGYFGASINDRAIAEAQRDLTRIETLKAIGEKLEKAKLRKEQISSGRSIGSASSTGGVTQLYDTYYLMCETIIEALKRGEMPEEAKE